MAAWIQKKIMSKLTSLQPSIKSSALSRTQCHTYGNIWSHQKRPFSICSWLATPFVNSYFVLNHMLHRGYFSFRGRSQSHGLISRENGDVSVTPNSTKHISHRPGHMTGNSVAQNNRIWLQNASLIMRYRMQIIYQEVQLIWKLWCNSRRDCICQDKALVNVPNCQNDQLVLLVPKSLWGLWSLVTSLWLLTWLSFKFGSVWNGSRLIHSHTLTNIGFVSCAQIRKQSRSFHASPHMNCYQDSAVHIA